MNANVKTHSFNGLIIHLIVYKGVSCFLASELALALGYADAKYVTRKLSGAWADEFEAGVDLFKIEDEELVQLKAMFSPSMSPFGSEWRDKSNHRTPHPVSDLNHRTPHPVSGSGQTPIHAKTTSVLLLSEPGLYTVCFLAKGKPKAREFRQWVSREILPEIRRTGGYGLAGGVSLEERRVALGEARVCLHYRKALLEERASTRDGRLTLIAEGLGRLSHELGSLVRRELHGPPEQSSLPFEPAANDDVDVIDMGDNEAS